MRNMQSTMRGYIFLGIFAIIMTVVMGMGQMSINQINDSKGLEISSTNQVSQSLEEDGDIEFLELVEIEHIPDQSLMIDL